MNQEFLYVILIIALGYILKRFSILEENDGEVISKLIFKITLPALIFVTFDSVKIDPALALLPVIVILYGAVVTILGLLFFKREERETKGAFLMLSSGFNVALFAFPLVVAIWGMDGLTYFSIFDVGTSLIVFGLAYILGSYYSKEGLSLKPTKILKKLGKSIPLMSYVIAVILNISNIHLPDFIIDVGSKISAANMPLSMLLLGLYLNLRFDKNLLKPILKYLTFRYTVGLAIGLTLFFTLPFDEMFRSTVLIGLLLPAASSSLVFAVEFKYSIQSIRLMAMISNIMIIISIIIFYVFANFVM